MTRENQCPHHLRACGGEAAGRGQLDARLAGSQLDAALAGPRWRGLLLTVCQVLAVRHGRGFTPAAFAVKGKVRQYVAAGPEGMIGPAPIPGTDLWLEANQSAVSAVRIANRLPGALGHQTSVLAVQAAA